MPIREAKGKYPLIDADPYAGRVIRYMRPSDYGYIAVGGALAPGLLYFYGKNRTYSYGDTRESHQVHVPD
jgi:NADH-ubiquinone oxidoreductase complex I, 21 kDa subunit